MLFIQALFSAIRRTFWFAGRSDRLEQWTFAFFTAALVVGLLIASEMGVRFDDREILAIAAVSMWLTLAHVSLFVRRLHDNGRSGLWMLVPAAAASLWLCGWLGANGYIEFEKMFFLRYGDWVMLAGRIACSSCSCFLLWIFLSEGEEDENIYGDPPL